MKIIIYILIYSCLLINYLKAQDIQGIVTDTLKQPIPFANISAKSADNVLITFATTDDKGVFVLKLPENSNPPIAIIEAAILGYKKLELPYFVNKNYYTFTLSTDYKELKTVIVKNTKPYIKTRGDTLTYKAKDFSKEQDRVIGDVIKRLPGIEVDANGKVSYQGKPISGFYLDGDNLLNDRYNIATNTIPNQAVDDIQVIENHQPIKILQNKSVSDDVAINITFTKDAKLKLMGQAQLGVGLPQQYEVDLNGLSFKNKYKAINYIKANNTSINLANDLLSHNMSDIKQTGFDKPRSILSLGTTKNPDLPQNRYLINNSGLINTNNLFKTKKDIQIRSNTYYLHDQQEQYFLKTEENYLLDDTISYKESQNNLQNYREFNTGLNIFANKNTYYLNNSFNVNTSDTRANSALAINNTSLSQRLKTDVNNFNNEINFMKPISDKLIIQLFSHISYQNRPEYLNIRPGVNDAFFNNGNPYEGINQNTRIPTWLNHTYLAFKIPIKKLILHNNLGYNSQSQLFKSELLPTFNNGIDFTKDSTKNQLDWLNKRLFYEAGLDFVTEKSKLYINLPIIFQNLNYTDTQYQLSSSTNNTYFNPNVQYRLKTGNENYIAARYHFKTEVGNIYDIYRGYILTNYRSLFTNNAELTEIKNQSASVGYYYRKSIKLFFFHINFTYQQNNANNITSNVITPEFQQRVILPLSNEINSWNLTGTVSKYIFPLHTTFAFTPSWRESKLNFIQNGTLLPFNIRTSSLNLSSDSKITDKLDFIHKINYSENQSSTFNNLNSKFIQIRQQSDFNYKLQKNLMINFSLDYYHINQYNNNKNLNYLFADFKTLLNSQKKKINFEIIARNILNTTAYKTATISDNLFSLSDFRIPGGMIIGRIRFNY